jgi:hypothetical protein
VLISRLLRTMPLPLLRSLLLPLHQEVHLPWQIMSCPWQLETHLLLPVISEVLVMTRPCRVSPLHHPQQTKQRAVSLSLYGMFHTSAPLRFSENALLASMWD